MLLRVALFACVLTRSPRVMADDTCATPADGVCLENGFPTTGVNFDDDCCALPFSASCAEGYAYSAGDLCASFSGAQARATCRLSTAPTAILPTSSVSSSGLSWAFDTYASFVRCTAPGAALSTPFT